MNNHYIYAFFDPITKMPKYIGRGTGYRMNWWKYYKGDDQYGVGPWLRSLTTQRLSPAVKVIISSLTKDQANAWEVGLIDLIGRDIEQTGPLLNISAGGESGTTGYRASDATRRLMAAIRTGKKASPKTKAKMSQAQDGRTFNDETIKRMSLAKLGKKASKTTCEKMSQTRLGRPQREDTVGVSEYKKTGQYRAYIRLPSNSQNSRRFKHLGLFNSKKDAMRAYNAAVDRYCGGALWKNRIDDTPVSVERRNPQSPEFGARLAHETCAKCPVRIK